MSDEEIIEQGDLDVPEVLDVPDVPEGIDPDVPDLPAPHTYYADCECESCRHESALRKGELAPAPETDDVAALDGDPAEPETPPEPRIIIHKARYGARASFVDVRDIVEKLASTGSASVVACNAIFTDPIPAVVKQLEVEYSVDGVEYAKTIKENETLIF